MIVPPGDEQMVLSDPITLNQKEPRLIEVSAWVMTDRLCMLQIDATDEKGHRLDGFNFIHKAPVSIGTDGWRQLRQVFRPGTPVKSLRLALCARGVNGYTLDGTGSQPQANVVGHIWWDEVKLTEPESDAAELAARGVKEAPAWENVEGLRIIDLDPGERLIGENFLRATVVNSGSPRTVSVRWEIGTSVHRSPSKQVGASPEVFEIPYQRFEASPHIPPYSATRSRFSLVDGDDTVATSDLWLDLWTVPIDLQLGALYLQPQQKQSVRMNLGLSQKTLSAVKRVRLDVTHRGTQYRVKQVFKSFNVEATPTAIREQREKMPPELRGDLRNLIIADLDLPFVPASAFADPKQEWFIRAIVLREDGKVVTQIDSRLFGRLAHEPPQAAIQSVAIKGNLVYVNGQPWIPFGVCYGHNPVYAGPADPGSGKYLDLHNLPGWSMYDQHNSASSSRKQFDFNCMRYVAGSITDHKTLAKRWQDDNLYCSSAFAIPQPAFSLPEVFKLAGGKDKLDAYLAQCKASPYVVSIAPGIEEAFGLFQGATPAQIKGMEEVVDYMRRQSGKPVMCGHGGYWNRLEFEKVPFFDIYDPETEPLYPANIHTDLAPLLNRAATVRERGGAALADARGSDKVIWLRPQMYESVPYERWRFHTYVELMRGCRGWQIAHGPGDASLFRGLHGEIEFWKPIVASKDPGPQVTVEPWIEHWSRKHNGKTYIIAATTHGIPFGKWETSDDAPPGSKHSRLTAWRHELRDESNAYGIGEFPETGPAFHGIQYLPDARSWPKGTKIVQWVKLGKEPLSGLVILAKADGRWTHAASWGKVDLGKLRKNPDTAYWFLNTAYRHAKGFLGWGKDLLSKSLDYIPDRATDFGALPAPGEWVKLEIPLETIGADGKLLDGVGFLCEGGPATWGKTSIVAPDGAETLVWGDTVQRSPEELAKVKITVPDLAKGSKVRVLFEDREIAADDGYFIDDFRGQDQYQRYGGGWGTGYGDAPVALHLYAVATK